MPPSIDVLTSSSALAWSTVLMALKSPLPSPNVMFRNRVSKPGDPYCRALPIPLCPPIGSAPVLEGNLPRRQTCPRRELQHELIIRNGSINGQLRYLKLDRVFLARSPDLYVRRETDPIDFPIFVVVNVCDDRSVLVI